MISANEYQQLALRTARKDLDSDAIERTYGFERRSY